MRQSLVSYSDTDSDESLVCVVSFINIFTVFDTSTSNVIHNILIAENTFTFIAVIQ